MKICTIGEIKEYFRNSENLTMDRIYVGTKLRCEWMLSHEGIIIRGKVYKVIFKNMGGGVWSAKATGGRP